jgi:hypothetical protein
MAIHMLCLISRKTMHFSCFFDFGLERYQIGFHAQKSKFNFWIEVHSGFYIKPYIDNDKFKELMDILHLTSDPNNKFKATLFFKNLTIISLHFFHRLIEKN